MGEWLTTTSRVVLNAATGLGKTNFGLALAGHAAAGRDFLYWRAHRPARVLFVDGEMSRRLLKRRAADMVRRLGVHPGTLYLLSHEDVENFQPLNTPAGRVFIEKLAAELQLDLSIFDNIMSLVAGIMADEEAWRGVLPLIASLTKSAVGQLWFHHTGHDKSRGFGTSTREWRMDTVATATEAKRADADVSFNSETGATPVTNR
jgi:RecA-family ATPase